MRLGSTSSQFFKTIRFSGTDNLPASLVAGLQNFGYFAWRQININALINHHRRSLITGTNAVSQLKGKFTIGGGLIRFNPDFPLQAFNDDVRVLETARQASTNPDYIPTLRSGGEKRVEGGYSVDIA